MNLRKEIKQAYQQIRVPADVSEHLKQALYQKDFREEEFTEIVFPDPFNVSVGLVFPFFKLKPEITIFSPS